MSEEIYFDILNEVKDLSSSADERFLTLFGATV